MTLSTKIEVFTDFTFVRSGPSYTLLSRVPFALAGLSCFHRFSRFVDSSKCGPHDFDPPVKKQFPRLKVAVILLC